MKQRVNNLFVGIDPGMNGGIVFIEPEGDTFKAIAKRCPKTSQEMARVFEMGIKEYAPNDIILYIEHVWAFPGDGRVSAFRFGYNYGLWKGIASAFEIDIIDVQPRKWMGHFEMPSKMDKKVRKQWLKDKAISLFPNIKVTFNVSDALLIAEYGKEAFFSGVYEEDMNAEGVGGVIK